MGCSMEQNRLTATSVSGIDSALSWDGEITLKNIHICSASTLQFITNRNIQSAVNPDILTFPTIAGSCQSIYNIIYNLMCYFWIQNVPIFSGGKIWTRYLILNTDFDKMTGFKVKKYDDCYMVSLQDPGSFCNVCVVIEWLFYIRWWITRRTIWCIYRVWKRGNVSYDGSLPLV